MDINAGLTLVEFLLFLVVGGIVVWIATLEFRFLRVTRTLRLLFSGRSGADLEQVLRDFMQRMDRADENAARLTGQVDRAVSGLTDRMGQLEARAPMNVQHVGVVRYNPFDDKGGDQSFAVALLDDHANGVVMSGLHSRSESRVYAKPVVGANSTYPLTQEEKEAIKRAMTPASPAPSREASLTPPAPARPLKG